MRDAFAYRLAQVFLQKPRVGRRDVKTIVVVFAVDFGADRRDHGRLESGFGQDMVYDARRRGFAVGAGHTDDGKAARRETIIQYCEAARNRVGEIFKVAKHSS